MNKQKAGMLTKVLGALGRLGRMVTGKPSGSVPFKPQTLGTSKVSLADEDRPADLFAVKQKLGASFFTRRLNPRTRAQRVDRLKADERRLARLAGWIR